MSWMKVLLNALLAIFTVVSAVFLSSRAEKYRNDARREENLQNMERNSAHQAQEHKEKAETAQKKAAEVDAKIDKKLDKLAGKSNETLKSRLDSWNSSRLHDPNS